jgi:hypothetical protein
VRFAHSATQLTTSYCIHSLTRFLRVSVFIAERSETESKYRPHSPLRHFGECLVIGNSFSFIIPNPFFSLHISSSYDLFQLRIQFINFFNFELSNHISYQVKNKYSIVKSGISALKSTLSSSDICNVIKTKYSKLSSYYHFFDYKGGTRKACFK